MKKKPLTNKSGQVRELTRQDIRIMQSANKVLPSSLLDVLAKRKRGQRGPQKQPKKISITLRYSPEVVKYFRAIGKGWQICMDEALKEWVRKHPRRASSSKDH
ncbi:MAG: BrnA antitoxin family protein [Gammaproteobacteria bacterium]